MTFFHRRINMEEYLILLCDQINHMITELFPAGNVIFQADNLTIQIAKFVTEVQEEHSSEVVHIILITQSTDLNIFQYLWYILVNNSTIITGRFDDIDENHIHFFWKQLKHFRGSN